MGTAIWLGDTTDNDAAREVFITDCVLAVVKNGQPGSTAFLIQSADEVFVSGCYIYGFTDGIVVTPGPAGWNAAHLHFTGCTVHTVTDASGNIGHACLIQPQGSGVSVGQVVFTSCFLELGQGAAPSDSGPGILIDASLGTVDTVRLVSCYSARWPGPGLELSGGVLNVEVLGGMYPGNNYHSNTDSCGIHVEDATGVRIIGVSCVGSYEYITGTGKHPSPVQDTGIIESDASEVIISGCDCRNNALQGILINGGASEVIIEACDVRSNVSNATGITVDASSAAVLDISVRGCNATGFGSYTGAVNVSGGSNADSLQVTNCAGYNDESVPVRAGTPPASGTSFSGATYGYYGPVECFIVPGTGTISSIVIGTTNILITTGSFWLNPGENAIVTWSSGIGSGPDLVMMGK